jgi:hypothetical protein
VPIFDADVKLGVSQNKAVSHYLQIWNDELGYWLTVRKLERPELPYVH